MEEKKKLYNSHPNIIQLNNKISVLEYEVTRLTKENGHSIDSMVSLVQDKMCYMRQLEEINEELNQENALLRNSSEVHKQNSMLNADNNELQEGKLILEEQIETLEQTIEGLEAQISSMQPKVKKDKIADVKLDYGERINEVSNDLEK